MSEVPNQSFFQKHKVTIFIGLAFFVMAQIFPFIGSLIINLLTFVSTSFSNYYYSELSDFNKVVPYYVILNTQLIIIVSLWVLMVWNELRRKKYPKTETEPNELKAADKILNKVLRYSQLFILGFFLALLITTTMRINMHFKQNDFKKELIILTPNVPQKTIDILKADWVQMESRKDYDKIIAEIGRLKENLP